MLGRFGINEGNVRAFQDLLWWWIDRCFGSLIHVPRLDLEGIRHDVRHWMHMLALYLNI
jgi:hypothetical protein